ncbi:MAG: Gldg family protein [Alphaproteobacteria bacterium]|nr:Gldg family protein [Alphaproteobacteria bacterium]
MASSSLQRGTLAILGLAFAVIAFVATNIVVDRRATGLRADLTQEKLFTLSPGTRSVLAKIDEPVTLRLYVSDRLVREIPSYGVYAARVRELLEEYRAAANGKVRLQIIDPQPFSDDEDRAVAMGLQGVPVNQSGELVYFGLAGTSSADKDGTIPFLQPERERFLEYDLTKLIFDLVTTKKKTIGLLSSLPLAGQFMGPRVPPQPWVIHDQLAQFFDVQRIERDATVIPETVSVLMLVHPKDLPDPTLYAIDQFVLRGGRVIAFVDPHAEGEMSRPGPAAQTGQTSSNIPRLLKSWGLELVEGKIAGDRQAARRVNAGDAQRVRSVDYLAWLTLRDAALAKSDVLLAEVQALNFASAGILKPIPDSGLQVTPLVQTSTQSQALDVEPLKFAPDPVALLANFKPSGERFTLVARVRGAIKTAFPEGAPKAEKKEGEENADKPAPALPAHLAESKEPINVIVVADTDMLEDRFWAQVQEFFGQRLAVPIANNGDFVINAIDHLAGSNDLISLRSRGQSARPFTVVQEIQRQAELAFRAKERALTDKLKETEAKLKELQVKEQGEGAARALVTAGQQQAIDQFRAEMLDTRRQLRDVQFDLRRDIQSLETTVRAVNIGLIPALIALFALGLGWWRVHRRRSASGTA